MFVVKRVANKHSLDHKALRLVQLSVTEFVELVRRQLDAMQMLNTLSDLLVGYRFHQKVFEV
jgi:hypothetical protein